MTEMASELSDESSDDSSDKIPKKVVRFNLANSASKLNNNYESNKLNKHNQKQDYTIFNVPETLCTCQQKCTERVTAPLIQKISMYFYGMRLNREKQKKYLANLILAKEKQIDSTIPKGKRIRKMSYRYFVPVLSDQDLKRQIEDNKEISPLKGKVILQNNDNGKAVMQRNRSSIQDDQDWDHIEVCLKAFTTVHTISEKRVIVTRNVCTLKSEIKCMTPFVPHGSLSQINFSYKPKTSKLEHSNNIMSSTNLSGPSDISMATAEWLSDHCKQQTSYAINPKTFLPEGLILPDSIICLPIFTEPVTNNLDPDRDIDIVDNFFFNQLWKPEYIDSTSDKVIAKNV